MLFAAYDCLSCSSRMCCCAFVQGHRFELLPELINIHVILLRPYKTCSVCDDDDDVTVPVTSLQIVLENVSWECLVFGHHDIYISQPTVQCGSNRDCRCWDTKE